MARPSRHLEALEVLRDFYREHGILPTIEVLARRMNYRSTSSAFNALGPLVAQGYVNREEEGGRLLPGPNFLPRTRAPAKPPGMPELGGKTIDEYLRASRRGTVLVQVATNALARHGVLKGDFLLVSKTEAPSKGALVVARRGRGLTVAPVGEASEHDSQTVLGVLIAQFRKY